MGSDFVFVLVIYIRNSAQEGAVVGEATAPFVSRELIRFILGNPFEITHVRNLAGYRESGYQWMYYLKASATNRTTFSQQEIN